MTSLLKDVSLLTDVSENTLKKFIPTITSCIGHTVYEGLASRSDVVEIDLEIGQLHIKLETDNIRYRFVPSKELEKLILNSITSNTSPILNKVELNLQQKIDRTYKELL